MNILVWIIVGGVLGWLASMVMHTNGQQGILLNVVVGIVGAFVAGQILSPILGVATINDGSFSLGAMFVSLVGAVLLLGVVNLLRRGAVR